MRVRHGLIIILLIILIYIGSVLYILYDYVKYVKLYESNYESDRTVNWMEYLYYNVPDWKNLTLSQICIIGTHDSATGCLGEGRMIHRQALHRRPQCYFQYADFIDYFLDYKYTHTECKGSSIDIFRCMLPMVSLQVLLKPFWKMISAYIIAWTKTQKYDIIGQLENGVRYFDMRMWVDNGGVYFHHGNVAFRESVARVFFNMLVFLRNNTKEIIILNMKHIITDLNNNDAASDKISQLAILTFRDMLIQPLDIPQEYLASTSIDALLTYGQVIIIQSNRQSVYDNYIYSGSLINSPYLSQDKSCTSNTIITKGNTFPTNWNTLKTRYLNCYSHNPSEGKLNVLQAHIQYSGDNVVDMIKKSICSLSFLPVSTNIINQTTKKQINTNLSSWLVDNATNTNMDINIIQVDNYDVSMLDSIIHVNEIKARIQDK